MAQAVIGSFWLVDGETDDDGLVEWKQLHPEFVESSGEWFHSEFVETREFIADDSDMCGGGRRMIFRSEQSARAYGARDAAIASGLRSPCPVLFVDLSDYRPSDEDFEELEEFDAIYSAFSEFLVDAAFDGVGGLPERDAILLPRDEHGFRALGELLKAAEKFGQFRRPIRAIAFER